MSNNITLTSLAILKVNLDRKHSDYLGYLEPFVGATLRRFHQNFPPHEITTATVQEGLRTEFGLQLPIPIIESVLRRFAKKQLLRRDNHRVFVNGELPGNEIEEQRNSLVQRQRHLVTSLRSFVAEIHKIGWSEEQSVNALLTYLQRFNIECLRTYEQRSALLPVPPPPSPSGEDARDVATFLVNAFARHCQEHEPPLFEMLIELVKGYMLANALVCEDLQTVTQRFDGVTFFLDTPIVLRLLHMGEEAFVAPSREMIELLHDLKGTTCVFEHNLEEVENVLLYHENSLERTRGGNRVTDSLRMSGKTPSDIAIIRGNLSKTLGELGISVQASPIYRADRYHLEIGESELSATLQDEINYQNPRAAEFDTKSLRGVFVLRGDSHPRDLENCRAVLVTSNATLASFAYHYGQGLTPPVQVSLVISDFSLTNVAWLKRPMARPELPRMEVLALCYAAMNPPEGLWAKYVQEIDKLLGQGGITEDQHLFLRSEEAQHELANLTLGSDEVYSPLLAHEVVERVRAKAVREVEQRAKKEVESQRQDYEMQLQNRDEKVNELTEGLKSANTRLAQLQDSMEKERAQREDDRKAKERLCEERAQKISRFVWRGIFILIATVVLSILIGNAVFTLWPSWFASESAKKAVKIAVWGTTLLAFIGVVNGTPVRVVTKAGEEWLANKLSARFKQRIL